MPGRPLAALVLAGVVCLVPTSAGAAPAPSGVLVTGQTNGCTEVAYTRSGLESVVRRLVPARYALVPAFTPPESPARVTLGINEWTCKVQAVENGQRNRQRDVAGLLVFAEIQTPDGQPLDEVYGLLLATEDRAESKAFTDAGWPADLLSRSSTVDRRTSSGGLLQATFSIRGGGWRHTVEAASIFPFGEPVASRASVVRDSGDQQLRLCFENEGAVVPGIVTGDQTQTPLADLTPVPPVYAGFPAQLSDGGWHSTLTTGACPTNATSTKSASEPWWKSTTRAPRGSVAELARSST